MKLKAILVPDIEKTILNYRSEIAREKNPKAKARLIEEQAMFKFVLRTSKQTTVTRTVKIRTMEI